MIKVSIICSLHRASKYLAGYLQNVNQQSIFASAELIFVQNDPQEDERRLIAEFASEHSNVRSLETEIEPLGASWNRGWQAARGEFVAIWNVDDQREPSSLERQIQALEANPGTVAAYGDYVEVSAFGSKEGKLRTTPEFDTDYFSRSFPQGGAFMVYRRQLLEDMGGFDEQFRVGPDMEYSLRIALSGRCIVRASGLMGYFTNEGAGLSTRATDDAAAKDRAAIYSRYAVYDKVNPKLNIDSFDLDKVVAFGKSNHLQIYWPQMNAHRAARKKLKSLGAVRFFLRNILSSIGILDFLHKMLARLFDQDI